MVQTLGVGIIGGGLATQAIHLPTLAKLGGKFRVARIMDVDAPTAANVAARCGATASTSAEEVFADPAIDMVVICSPNAFHAEQAIAACRAGKRMVLVEKPLAVSRVEALEVVRVAKETGSCIVVGAMHVYDPAYRAARAAWSETRDEATHVHSVIFLPTMSISSIRRRIARRCPRPRRVDPRSRGLKVQASMLRIAILGLAIHDLPLIRSFVPTIDTIQSARFVPGFGYEMSFIGRRRSVRLLALMPGAWAPHWTLRAMGRRMNSSRRFRRPTCSQDLRAARSGRLTGASLLNATKAAMKQCGATPMRSRWARNRRLRDQSISSPISTTPWISPIGSTLSLE